MLELPVILEKLRELFKVQTINFSYKFDPNAVNYATSIKVDLGTQRVANHHAETKIDKFASVSSYGLALIDDFILQYKSAIADGETPQGRIPDLKEMLAKLENLRSEVQI